VNVEYDTAYSGRDYKLFEGIFFVHHHNMEAGGSPKRRYLDYIASHQQKFIFLSMAIITSTITKQERGYIILYNLHMLNVALG
jgi:hypothetical protein